MAYRGALRMLAQFEAARRGANLITWRGLSIWPSGNRQSVRDLTVEIVCDGSVVRFQ